MNENFPPRQRKKYRQAATHRMAAMTVTARDFRLSGLTPAVCMELILKPACFRAVDRGLYSRNTRDALTIAFVILNGRISAGISAITSPLVTPI